MKKQIVVRTEGGYGKEGQSTLQNFMNQGYNVAFATKLGYEVEYILEKDVQLDELYTARMELLKIDEYSQETTNKTEFEILEECLLRASRAEKGIMKFLNDYRER